MNVFPDRPAAPRPCRLLGRSAAFAIGLAFASSAAWPHATSATEPRLVPVHGAALAVTVEGRGAPVVFLHGGLQSFEGEFGAQRADFMTDHQVIGIDQRGHGLSPDTPEPFSYRAMAEDTAAVLRALSVGPADLVGHSDGADVALLVAALHPELVRRVVAVGPNLRADAYGADNVQHLRDTQPEVLATRVPAAFRAAYDKLSPDGPSHWVRHVDKSRQLWMTEVVIAPEELARIQVPVLIVAGDQDFAPLEHTAAIFRGLPKGQLYIVPATAHDGLTSRSAEVDAVIRRFLTAP